MGQVVILGGALFLVSCGGSSESVNLLSGRQGGAPTIEGSSAQGTQGGALTVDGTPTLGITSIQKNQGQLAAKRFASVTALNCDETAVHQFNISGGSVWISQAYLIIDEIEMHLPNGTMEAHLPGPYAFDLTASDPDIPEDLELEIPSEDYTEIRFKINRFDIDKPPRNLGDQLSAFILKIFDQEKKQRPSIWIEGWLRETTETIVPATCHSFTLLTDQTWLMEVPFLPGKTVNPTKVDLVFLSDLPGAFQASGVTVSELISEIGQNGGTESSENPLGHNFLDGRLINAKKWGTPGAMKIAETLPQQFKVFTQEVGTFVGDPSVGADAEEVSGSIRFLTE
ncbi:MAG: hypothetical protein ACE5FY_05380 [Nitrospiria bacterium]